ncbi:MAG: hypothetical protein ACFFB3_17995 [Candidatus Hodarchaeota archaeon]
MHTVEKQKKKSITPALVELLDMQKASNDSFLKFAFLFSGIYDIILGLALLFFVDPLSELLDFTKPEPPFFGHTLGIFLVVMGYFLIYAIQDPRKMAFIGAGSFVVRFAYSAIIFLLWFSQEIDTLYLLLGITDTLTGALILFALLATETFSFKQLWKF